ncbi:hypothetical protein LIER_31676 [Lithospermum erythrorhizon]|uniref:Uncharacterized protein n=1 Tax=Lithospermum erythrorhizon TaxID=34254 RepID=A0AAV3RTK0_LITER
MRHKKDEALSDRGKVVEVCRKLQSEHEEHLSAAREASALHKVEVARLHTANKELEAVNKGHEFHIQEAQSLLEGHSTVIKKFDKGIIERYMRLIVVYISLIIEWCGRSHFILQTSYWKGKRINGPNG